MRDILRFRAQLILLILICALFQSLPGIASASHLEEAELRLLHQTDRDSTEFNVYRLQVNDGHIEGATSIIVDDSEVIVTIDAVTQNVFIEESQDALFVYGMNDLESDTGCVGNHSGQVAFLYRLNFDDRSASFHQFDASWGQLDGIIVDDSRVAAVFSGAPDADALRVAMLEPEGLRHLAWVNATEMVYFSDGLFSDSSLILAIGSRGQVDVDGVLVHTSWERAASLIEIDLVDAELGRHQTFESEANGHGSPSVHIDRVVEDAAGGLYLAAEYEGNLETLPGHWENQTGAMANTVIWKVGPRFEPVAALRFSSLYTNAGFGFNIIDDALIIGIDWSDELSIDDEVISGGEEGPAHFAIRATDLQSWTHALHDPGYLIGEVGTERGTFSLYSNQSLRENGSIALVDYDGASFQMQSIDKSVDAFDLESAASLGCVLDAMLISTLPEENHDFGTLLALLCLLLLLVLNRWSRAEHLKSGP